MPPPAAAPPPTPAPAPLPAASDSGKVKKVYKRNENTDEDLTKFKTRNCSVTKIINAVGNLLPLPTTADGQTLCLAWQINGGCTTSCKRAALHQPLTPTKMQKTLEFCTKGVETLQGS